MNIFIGHTFVCFLIATKEQFAPGSAALKICSLCYLFQFSRYDLVSIDC
jgi:hypothetical protein